MRAAFEGRLHADRLYRRVADRRSSHAFEAIGPLGVRCPRLRMHVPVEGDGRGSRVEGDDRGDNESEWGGMAGLRVR